MSDSGPNSDTKRYIDSLAEQADAQHEAQMAEEANRAANYVPALSPNQATQYEGTDYMQPPQMVQTPEQRFAEAMQMWQQPGSTPATAQSAKLGAEAYAPQPELSTPGMNLQAAQEAPEAFNAMQGSMAGTGLQANMPTPLAPAQAPQQLEPAQAAEQQVAQEQGQRQIATEQAQARQAAQQEIEAKAQHEANIQAAAQEKIESADAKAATQNWGSIVGQGIAVAMGEYGRYLTGGKENLAVASIDRAAKEKAEKEKLSLEERLAGQKRALDIAGLKLKEEELKTDSQLKRAQIAKIGAEIGVQKQKLAAQQKIAALVKSGKGFAAEDLSVLPEGDRERAVMLPDGTYALAAVNKERLNKGQEVIDGANLGLKDLQGLQKLTDYFGNNVGKKVVDRETIAQAKTLAQTLKGRLRLSLLGPGAITDFEHKMLDNIIRDPTAIMSFGSANKAALQTLANKLSTERKYTYRSLGVNLPPSANERNIGALKAANPTMTDSQAIDRITKLGMWKDE